MKYLLSLFLLLNFNAQAQDKGDLIFQDDFERTESDEKKEEPGNGWITNSKSRAKGNKQVDLRDGALYIYTHAEADHAAVAKHPIGFQDGTILMKVKFETSKDTININIADMKEKSVHAGHLFNVTINPNRVQLTDLKTGRMKLEVRKANKAKTLTPEQKKLIKSKTKTFKTNLELNKWHTVIATIKGNELSCTLNGKNIGSYKSEGFGHPSKKEIRLIVNKNVYVDDIKVWKKK